MVPRAAMRWERCERRWRRPRSRRSSVHGAEEGDESSSRSVSERAAPRERLLLPARVVCVHAMNEYDARWGDYTSWKSKPPVTLQLYCMFPRMRASSSSGTLQRPHTTSTPRHIPLLRVHLRAVPLPVRIPTDLQRAYETIAYARRHTAAPPAHGADTSDAGGTHFALVLPNLPFFTQEGRRKLSTHVRGVHFFDVSRTQRQPPVSYVRACGNEGDAGVRACVRTASRPPVHVALMIAHPQ